ncbi:hypothetical protein BH11BAC2_BH11BAC2_19530 [soil metagenome]
MQLKNINSSDSIAVIGAGAMGSGIAQVAATAGHTVWLFDTRAHAVESALKALAVTMDKLVAKQKISADTAQQIIARIKPALDLKDLSDCALIIEAIIEQVQVKQELFRNLETVISENAVLASNTSSLSITAIAGACKNPERVIGLHFFNPAPLMPLVEIIPALQTDTALPALMKSLMLTWNKVPVLVKDTPGFIVNRVARPFYGEALRICEEGIADQPTIDAAMKKQGGFKMGPFELMDLIGNDINYTVTETVWTQCYFDPRYRPSLIQKKMVESGRLGRKTGRGYYNYNADAVQPVAAIDDALGNKIVNRILAMLINEAADALYYGIASKEDIDLAMTKGVNYPKGLLQWADEWGIENVINELKSLSETYEEDRYRPSVLLKKMAAAHQKFFS